MPSRIWISDKQWTIFFFFFWYKHVSNAVYYLLNLATPLGEAHARQKGQDSKGRARPASGRGVKGRGNVGEDPKRKQGSWEDQTFILRRRILGCVTCSDLRFRRLFKGKNSKTSEEAIYCCDDDGDNNNNGNTHLDIYAKMSMYF